MSFLPILIGAVLSAAGIALAAGGLKTKGREKAARAWPAAEGEILTSQVAEHASSGVTAGGRKAKKISYEPQIKYSYTQGGKKHAGKRIGLDTPRYLSKAKAEALAASYPPGSAAKILVNPEDPKEALLDPSVNDAAGQFLVGFAALAAGILILAFSGPLGRIFAF